MKATRRSTTTERILITGVAGFVGKHLARLLGSTTDAQLFGVDRHGAPEMDCGLSLGLGERLRCMAGDMSDSARIREIVAESRPTWIVHLAAQAFVPTAFADPMGTLVNNIAGQVNLSEAVLAMDLRPRMLVICSNEEYGMVAPEELPVKETAPFRPANPYAVSKVAQDMLGYQYFVSHGLPIVRVRPFNHLGPGQSDRFVSSAFARQIAEAEAGLREPVLSVGNLTAERDFSDVRDIVRAYKLALE
ncbi:MAG TPA: GDP-mannose 4,6-dehydratase, partial [Chloroflexota bacterium]|nr:GDP-mannose 4,6-dehydratase [Chloroflexota bacterium]